MDCETCQDRLIDQLTGGVAPDAGEAAAHLAQCENCREEFLALGKAFHAIGLGFPPAVVSSELKQRLLDQIDNEVAGAPASLRLPVSAAAASASSSGSVDEPWISRAFKLFVTAAVAAGVAVVVTHAIMMSHVRDLQNRTESLYQALQFSEQQNVSLQEDLKQHGSEMKVLQAADLRLVNLAAQPNAGGAGRLFFDNNHGGMLVVRDAPPAPHGRTYELWLIDATQKKTAAGVFNVDKDGAARLPVNFDPAIARGADVAAITDEPPGGVTQPTGSIRFVGKVQSAG